MALLHHIFSMATVSLIVLVVQNSLLVVMTRFSRHNVEASQNYHTSTLVMNQEIAKMILCLIIYGVDDVYKQFRQTVASSDRANSTFHSVLVIESDVPLTREDGVKSMERVASPTERVDTQPFVEEEVADARITSSSTPPPLPLAVVSAAVESSCQPGDEFGADHDAHGARPVTSVYCNNNPLNTAASFSRQLRRPLRPKSSTGRSNSPMYTSRPVPGYGEWNGGLEAPALPRKHKFFVTHRGLQALCSLYCFMLSASVCKRDTLKLFVPACLFNLQNLLIFVGLSNLDAVSFQVWSQTKLLSTAIFSVWLLGRKLSPMQWLSLAALTAGVLGAQLGARGAGEGTHLTPAPHLLSVPARSPGASSAEAQRADNNEQPSGSALIGIAACLVSGLSSSYAGVYFEMVIKTTSPTLSIRNIQLSLFGIPLAFLSMMILDVVPNWYASAHCGQAVHWNIFSAPVAETGVTRHTKDHCPVRPFYFWQRYDQPLTWALVSIHAFGGLLVALVVKYADNILKGFATGVAVIVSGMMSSAIGRYEPTLAFVLGAVLVIGSSIVFHKFEPKR
ncbi:hypothetical protein LSCM1_06685 [Leishmania martiniquensis]|uniref:UDP-galactose transporter n=1 Tax=Leishmania martiniquensis TaxID=1580590 RepID=A0A836KSE9_9TRYP|nr:hypothetical protein LSCM1_06685 [Leishmania martiniquensis]